MFIRRVLIATFTAYSFVGNIYGATLFDAKIICNDHSGAKLFSGKMRVEEYSHFGGTISQSLVRGYRLRIISLGNENSSDCDDREYFVKLSNIETVLECATLKIEAYPDIFPEGKVGGCHPNFL